MGVTRSGLANAVAFLCAVLPSAELRSQTTFHGTTITALGTGSYSSVEARRAVERVVAAVGLAPNFTVVSADCAVVNNAEAGMRGSDRFIWYCEAFMQRALVEAKTDWAAISIIAHEIGHHLNSHRGGSRPPIELEADAFSGFAMARLGADLAQATAAMRAVSKGCSDTHPCLADRVRAIAVGWRKAGGSIAVGGCPAMDTTGASLRNGGGRENGFFICDGRYYVAVTGAWDDGTAGFDCQVRVDRASDFTKVAESERLTTRGSGRTVWERRIPELGRTISVFLRGGRGPVCDLNVHLY